MWLPARPSETTVRPSRGCTGSAKEPLPPRPGLRARRLGASTLLVRVTFAGVPRRCRPTWIRLTLDVNDDPLPPDAGLFKVAQLRRPLKVAIPPRVRNADVIRASSVMRSGASSRSTPVLIVGP